MNKTKEFQKIISELEGIFKRCENHGITLAIVASDGKNDLRIACGTIQAISDIISSKEDSVILKAAKLAAAGVLIKELLPENQ